MSHFSQLIKIFVFLVLFLGCKVEKTHHRIEQVTIYNRFISQGTISDIRFAFSDYIINNVDTSPSRFYLTSNLIFERALNGARVSRFIPPKVGGIKFAGNFFDEGKTHFFAYFDLPYVIIDYTGKRFYLLKEDPYQRIK